MFDCVESEGFSSGFQQVNTARVGKHTGGSSSNMLMMFTCCKSDEECEKETCSWFMYGCMRKTIRQKRFVLFQNAKLSFQAGLTGW